MFPRRDLNYVEKPIVASLEKDGKNKDDFFCAAGSIDGKEFANNYGGWPRSELAIINEQTDINVAKAMIQKLDSFDVKPANVGLTDEQIIGTTRSKYCQAPAEQAKFVERCMIERDNRLAYLRSIREAQKIEQEQKIKFNENVE